MYFPSGHDDNGTTQALLDVLPTGDVRFAGQSEQVEDPAMEYLPMPHVAEQDISGKYG
jgi:hypothetical protein